ncbi:hypothetical protein BAUCODRAFT_60123, partial [Baudoinia panamericana UAMH 10762]
IRLLKFEIARDHTLYFALEAFLLADAPPYLALSYTWGPAEESEFARRNAAQLKHDEPPKPCTVIVNGSTVQVTANLNDFFRHYEAHVDSANYASLHIWIDALCINQSDRIEKAVQVMQMDRVYSCAQCVVVWLG